MKDESFKRFYGGVIFSWTRFPCDRHLLDSVVDDSQHTVCAPRTSCLLVDIHMQVNKLRCEGKSLLALLFLHAFYTSFFTR